MDHNHADYPLSYDRHNIFLNNGTHGRTRTCDKLVNSQLLYRLSYMGVFILIPLMVLRGGIEPPACCL